MKKQIFVWLLVAFSFQSHAQKFTFVFLNKKPDAEKLAPEDSKKIMDGHMANINRLAKEGKLISAGPFDGGGGIFILNTTSQEEAQQWLSSDPGVQARRWNIEMLPYTPVNGSACTVAEPYKMVNYTFVRFTVDSDKSSSKNFDELLKRHGAFLETLALPDSLVTRGQFGPRQGDIFVTRGEVTKEALEKDPAVKEGALLYEIKNLWIARGAFCEK